MQVRFRQPMGTQQPLRCTATRIARQLNCFIDDSRSIHVLAQDAFTVHDEAVWTLGNTAKLARFGQVCGSMTMMLPDLENAPP